ncbi:unnamed protein product [Heligmosomoides polygyrus]|uniref:AAA_11 domain-containing protein n=1 Tax=Heligmosomoides polygyrus TaxID=6339 RepID=A0A183FB86_HELPZ|nr:unnamed protein product [Heligmosomoides polygyrus]
MGDTRVWVTAELHLKDTTRFRSYMLSTPHRHMAVGTSLSSVEERANPVLAMLENCRMASTFEPDTTSWLAARAVLAGDADILAQQVEERTSITVNVSGNDVELNADQVNAVNSFNRQSPVLIFDSAYGAGKSLCTAVMAEEVVKRGKTVLVAAVQNSALDVICAKIAELRSDSIRPVRYVSELLSQDAAHNEPFNMATLMENLPSTHGEVMSKNDLAMFEEFAEHRNALRKFVFTGEERGVATREHKRLLFPERYASTRIKKLNRAFIRIYKPNVFLCTISSAINLTIRKSLWRRPSREWSAVLLDEASMIPDATFIALLSRFQYACYTLVGDSKQLPPYVGVHNVPKAVALCSQSVLDVAHRRGNAPVCTIRTVYRPHAGLMRLNSRFFYDDALRCGTPVELRPKSAVACETDESRDSTRSCERERSRGQIRY